MKWPEVHWPVLVQGVLVGKARRAYDDLSLERALEYTSIKETILSAYDMVPEVYRLKFRNLPLGNMSYVEWAAEKARLLKKWCRAARAKTMEDLQQLMVMEDLNKIVPPKVQLIMDERGDRGVKGCSAG